jgi:hypothetical protein
MIATGALPAYQLSNGLHPESASLAALLAAAGLTDTATGRPLSEATILGIGGGLGVGYILWEFKAYTNPILVMGMTNRWQYSDSLYSKVSERLGILFAVAETGGAKGAAAALDAAFGLQRPAMLWVDQSGLPWFALEKELDGCFGHTVVACGADGELVTVDDRAARPFTLERSQLALARGRIGSYKNRLLMVESLGDEPKDVETAMAAGIRDCAEHLAQPSDSFSLPVIRKWARLMTDPRNKKGWPTVFADGKGLFSTLISVFEALSDYGTAGGSLRGLYADFLDDAARRLETPLLATCATHYRNLALRWNILAETVLPTAEPAFAAAKDLVAQRQALLTGLGGDGVAESIALREELNTLRTRHDPACPLDADGRMELFRTMQGELETIYTEEVEANRLLQEAAAAL